MTEYEFKKLKPDDVASNLYTGNYCGNIEGKFYNKEDVIIMLANFVNTFSPVANSIKEMVAFYNELIINKQQDEQENRKNFQR